MQLHPRRLAVLFSTSAIETKRKRRESQQKEVQPSLKGLTPGAAGGGRGRQGAGEAQRDRSFMANDHKSKRETYPGYGGETAVAGGGVYYIAKGRGGRRRSHHHHSKHKIFNSQEMRRLRVLYLV